MENYILEKTDRPVVVVLLLGNTVAGGAVTLRSQKSVNNTDDFLILRLTEIARIQKWMDIDIHTQTKGCAVRQTRCAWW